MRTRRSGGEGLPAARALRSGRALLFIAGLAAALAACSSSDDPAPPPPVVGRALVPLYNAGETGVVEIRGAASASLALRISSPVTQAVAVRADRTRAVLVSAEAGSTVEYDLTANPPVPTGRTTDALAGDGGAFVATYGGNTVALVSYAFRTAALWQPPAAAVVLTIQDAALWDVAANADGTRYFLADSARRGGVHVVDGSGTSIESYLFAQEADVPSTSAGPVALALSPDGDRLYVANGLTSGPGSADDLLVFDVAADGQLTFAKSVPLRDADEPGVVANLWNSTGMVVSPDGAEVWIAWDGGGGAETEPGGVAVYRTADDRVDVVPFAAGTRPCEIAVDWELGTAYLPGYDYTALGDDRLWMVDVVTRAVRSLDLPAGSGPTGIGLY